MLSMPGCTRLTDGTRMEYKEWTLYPSPACGYAADILLICASQWSRLIGAAPSPSSRHPRGNAVAERHTAFKHVYNTLYQIWRNSPSLTPESPSIPRIRNCLDRLNAVLADESRGPAPHPCLSFAATPQVYLTIAKLALSTYDPHIVAATTVFFTVLIDAEVEGVVDSTAFSRALVDLVRRASCTGEECESKLVELMFGVANNIRLQPAILPAWFFPKEPVTEADAREAGQLFAGATRKDDFPLFYLLLEYVHCSGRQGDFARTGLLYIIETASKAKNLERWLIESDLATLMATGLGGLYSQLSRVLPSIHDIEIPPIISLSDDTHPKVFICHDLGHNMDSFLSYLLFWQDAVDHCRSTELNDTLLDHFQVLFLEQLLYPSLLESSDVDGGSTPAVTTYLSRILDSIDQPELIHRILHFLLASPSQHDSQAIKQVEKPKMSVSRRKSLDILAVFAEAAAIPSPTLFNLVDLVSMGIKSNNIQTLVATLRLMTVIMERHQHFTKFLLKTREKSEAESLQRSHGALNAELQGLLGLAAAIDGRPILDQSYSTYVASALAALASRSTMIPLNQAIPRPSSLLHNDGSIFKGLLDLLRRFFVNGVTTNLALTSAVAALATSNLISLDGWLLVPPKKYHLPNNGCKQPTKTALSPSQQSCDGSLAYQQPSWSGGDTPTLTSVLNSLVRRIQSWRKSISDFDNLVAGRRALLSLSEAETREAESSQTARAVGVRREKTSRGRNSVRIRGWDDNYPSSGAKSRFLSKDSGSSTRASSAHLAPALPCSRAAVPGSLTNLHERLAGLFSTELCRSSEVTSPSTLAFDPDSVEAGVDLQDVTLGHVLTNIVILYDFVLELTALVQMRGSMFQEVEFGSLVEL
ncbi:hypothetical protein LOZ53_005695 [Ophidiomyces ophidiicola]|nr:hypothetical protein LOZ53_005695 [Ophidiomyces ophidiicola]